MPLIKPLFFIFLILSFSILFFACQKDKNDKIIYRSEALEIHKISDQIYKYVSYLKTKSFGYFPCNGMIFIDNQEAIVFDTPTTDSIGIELIQYVSDSLKSKIKAVVVNHFHVDCLGGLKAFHNKGILSYAHKMTVDFAKRDSLIIPLYAFENKNEITVGNSKVINQYLGKAHTLDNIVSYVPSQKTLFGGCMIKELDAGKGYLGDASVTDWPKTVKNVKELFPEAKTIIPGHGKEGGRELFDYTIDLFTEN